MFSVRKKIIFIIVIFCLIFNLIFVYFHKNVNAAFVVDDATIVVCLSVLALGGVSVASLNSDDAIQIATDFYEFCSENYVGVYNKIDQLVRDFSLNGTNVFRVALSSCIVFDEAIVNFLKDYVTSDGLVFYPFEFTTSVDSVNSVFYNACYNKFGYYPNSVYDFNKYLKDANNCIYVKIFDCTYTGSGVYDSCPDSFYAIFVSLDSADFSDVTTLAGLDTFAVNVSGSNPSFGLFSTTVQKYKMFSSILLGDTYSAWDRVVTPIELSFDWCIANKVTQVTSELPLNVINPFTKTIDECIADISSDYGFVDTDTGEPYVVLDIPLTEASENGVASVVSSIVLPNVLTADDTIVRDPASELEADSTVVTKTGIDWLDRLLESFIAMFKALFVPAVDLPTRFMRLKSQYLSGSSSANTLYLFDEVVIPDITLNGVVYVDNHFIRDHILEIRPLLQVSIIVLYLVSQIYFVGSMFGAFFHRTKKD